MLPKAVLVPLIVGASTLPAALAAAPRFTGSDVDVLHARSDGVAFHARADKATTPKDKTDAKKVDDSSDFSDDDLDVGSSPTKSPSSPKSPGIIKDVKKTDGAKKDDKSKIKTNTKDSTLNSPTSPTSPASPGSPSSPHYHHGRIGITKHHPHGKNAQHVPIFTKLHKQNDKDRAVCAKRQQKWCKDPKSEECKHIKEDCQKFDKIQKEYQELSNKKKQCKADEKKSCKDPKAKECVKAHDTCKQLNTKAKALMHQEKKVHNEEKKRECKAAMKKFCDGKDKTKCQHVKNECTNGGQTKTQRAAKCQSDYKKLCDGKHEKECTALKTKCGKLVTKHNMAFQPKSPGASSPKDKKEKKEKESNGGGSPSGGGGGGSPKSSSKPDDHGNNPVLTKSSGGSKDHKSDSKDDDHKSTGSGAGKTSGSGAGAGSKDTDPLDDPDLKIFSKRDPGPPELSIPIVARSHSRQFEARSPLEASGFNTHDPRSILSPGSGVLTARDPGSPVVLGAAGIAARSPRGGSGLGSLFKSAKQVTHGLHELSDATEQAGNVMNNVGNAAVGVKSTRDRLKGKAPAVQNGVNGMQGGMQGGYGGY